VQSRYEGGKPILGYIKKSVAIRSRELRCWRGYIWKAVFSLGLCNSWRVLWSWRESSGSL